MYARRLLYRDPANRYTFLLLLASGMAVGLWAIVGCGMAVCPTLGQVWVCNYRPRGNVRIIRRPN
jgi:hypothetical protein